MTMPAKKATVKKATVKKATVKKATVGRSAATAPTAATKQTPPARRRRPSRRRGQHTGPLLTASGVLGLQEHIDRLRTDLVEYRELMSDPKRDERVVLELERLIEEVTRFEALIAEAVVIDEEAAAAAEVVAVGTRVLVRFADGDTDVVRVVHPAEAFLDEERVSSDAPLAKALIGLSVGDKGQVVAPRGSFGFTVVALGAAVDAA